MLRPALLLIALAACSKDAGPVQVGGPGFDSGAAAPAKPEAVSPATPDAAAPAKSGDASLASLPLVDLVGYLTGNYHTSSNNPAMYVDRERKLFVMMGAHGKAELPLADPAAATRAFETFLLQHGYAANGKPAPDPHQKVMVNGQEMVVMSTDELFPEMPADLKAHFTPAQLALIGRTATDAGMNVVAAKTPVIRAYTHTLVVVGPGAKSHEFPIAQADAAFAAFRALAAK